MSTVGRNAIVSVSVAFLLFAAAGDGGRVVGHCSQTDDERVDVVEIRIDGRGHLRGARNVDARDAVGVGSDVRPADEGHARLRLCGACANGVAHLARARVGDAAHGIDRFEGGPAVNSSVRACSNFRLRGGDNRFENLLGLEHSAVAGFGRRLGRRCLDPRRRRRRDEPRDVALRERRSPTSDGSSPAATSPYSGSRAPSASVDRRSSAWPLRNLREKVRGRRRDDDGGGAARTN
jgi:hypothetical protein